MKKFSAIFLIICFTMFFCAGCTKKTTSSMIKSERRFEKFMAAPNNNSGNVVDLSEGPKLRYEANFGPQKLDFDMKIVDPY